MNDRDPAAITQLLDAKGWWVNTGIMQSVPVVAFARTRGGDVYALVAYTSGVRQVPLLELDGLVCDA